MCFYALLGRIVSGGHQEDDRGWSEHDDEDSFLDDQEGVSSGCSHVDDQGHGIGE
jgi:hypothetical protein